MILGLDMATKKTGYCLLGEGYKLYKYGLIRTKGSDARERIREIYEVIDDILKKNNIDKVILEDVPVTNHNNLRTGKELCILQGAVLSLCFKYGLDYKLYAPSGWRSIVNLYDGTREGTRRDVQKQKAVDLVNSKYALNFVYNKNETKTKTTDDDMAEAICIALAYEKESEKND